MTKAEREARRELEPFPFKGPMRSLRCCGLKPSGPPAELLGKDRMERAISFSLMENDCLVGGRSGMTESAGGALNYYYDNNNNNYFYMYVKL